MLTFLKTLFQRLVSTDWKTAGVELAAIIAAIAKLVSDIRSKDFMGFITDVSDPNGLLANFALIGITLRLTSSSNTKAIANPDLPQITGDAPKP
jgi:hypothetical protein